MRKFAALLISVILLWAAPAQAAAVTITNGTQFGGVHAHDGGVI